MKVPIAGPCFSCFGVVAMLILPTTFDGAGSSTRFTRPVYSVSAVHLPSSITLHLLGGVERSGAFGSRE